MYSTLRYGARGNDVIVAQNGLNQLPSHQPGLTADGIYGMRSVARAREFQAANGLVADGIVGPKTWSVLLRLIGQVIGQPPARPPSAFDAARPQAIKIAEGMVGKVDFSIMSAGRPKGIDLIKEFFDEATGRQLTDENFRNTQGWTHVPIVDGGAKSWCGIFCVYCYRKAGLRSISWDLTGGPRGPIRLATWSPDFVDGIKTADMGAVATRSHHFLIKAVQPGSKVPRIHSIDGNGAFGRIEHRDFGHYKGHQVGRDNFNYYSLGN